MKSFLLIVFIVLICCPLLGFASTVTKTVGVGQDYTTIADALADINTNGLADTVSLMLMDTLYSESPLMYNPTQPQPTALYIAQGGTAKPHVQINAGGLPYGMLINNREDFVLYNVIVEPSPSTTWLAGVNVRSMGENSRVYIQSGGVTGSTTQRGYDVLADSSSGVYVFGCLVINVQSVGIYIELQNFALAKVNGGKHSISSLSGAGEIRLNGNTISSVDTGMVLRSPSGALDILAAQVDSNSFDNIKQAVVFDQISADSTSFSMNYCLEPYYQAHRQCLFAIGRKGFAVAKGTTTTATDPNKQLNINGNYFEVGAVTGSIIEVDASGYNLTCSNNTMRSSSISPTGVLITNLQGTNTIYNAEGNTISGFDIGTQLENLGDGAEVHFSGGADTVGSKAIYLPNGHNVSVFEVSSGSFASSPQRTRYRVVSLEKFSAMKGMNLLSSSNENNAIDVTINNDPGVFSNVGISNVDFDWTVKAIDIKGNFEGNVETEGNNIALSGNLGNEEEIAIHVRGLSGAGSSFTSNGDVINPANRGIVLDSLKGGLVQIGACNITAGTSAIEATDSYEYNRRLVIYLRESFDYLSSSKMTRLRAVSLRKAAMAKGFDVNSYDPSSAIKLNLHTDSAEVTIENGDIDWVGNGIVLDASPMTKFNFNNLDINLNNSGGNVAMQYRAKRAEVQPNIDGIKTAELNYVRNAGTGMQFEMQPYTQGLPLNGIAVKNNTITSCGVGIDILAENDTTGGGTLEGIIFPPVVIEDNTIDGILAAIAIPNFVAMQYRSKRSELPTNVDAIRIKENTLSSGGFNSTGLSFDFYPTGSVEIDSNTFSGFRSNLQLGQLSTKDYIGDNDWYGRPLSISSNTFEGGGLDLDVFDHALTLQGNNFTCISGSSSTAVQMPVGQYELNVRRANKSRVAALSKNGISMPSFGVLLSGNTFCDGDLIVNVANDDSAYSPGTTTITNNQSNGNVTITTYDTENDISGNTFNNTSAMTSSSMAMRKYELQVRASSRQQYSSFHSSATGDALLNYHHNTLTGFEDVSISIEDTAGTGSVSLDSNTVSTGSMATSSSMPANRYEVSFKKSKTITMATSSSVGGGSTFDYSNNTVTGYSDVAIDLDDSSETLSAQFEHNSFNAGNTLASSFMAGNRYEVGFRKSKTVTMATISSVGGGSTFDYSNNTVTGYSDVAIDLDDSSETLSAQFEHNSFNAGNALASSSMPANRYEVSFKKSKSVSLASRNSLSGAVSSFVYDSNAVSGYSNVVFDVNDETGAQVSSVSGNTLTGTGSITGSNNVAAAGNKLEINIRRGSRINYTLGSLAVSGNEWFTYENNTVSGFSGGLFDLENNGVAGIARLEGNTFSGGTFSLTPKPMDNTVMLAKSWELNIRRANRATLAGYSSAAIADSLILRNNTFTGLDGGGLTIYTSNIDVYYPILVWVDANALSSTSLPFTFELQEAEIDSGLTEFMVTGNVIEGGLTTFLTSPTWCNRFGLYTSTLHNSTSGSQRPNTFTNGQGLVFYREPAEQIKFNYQNVVGNSMNIVNRTNTQIDARYCWWGTTNRDEIASKMEGDVLFEPFLTDSVVSSVGSINGRVYLDADASYSYDGGEMLLAGQEVTLWQNGTQIAADTTDGIGTYSFADIQLGSYEVQLTMPSGYVGTENDNGATVDFISGGMATENFGIYQELQRFRTFAADTLLSKKPVKIAFKGDILTSQYPNTATALENVFARIGKKGATFLGISQTDKNRAKKYAWIAYAKAADLGKLYTSAHSGSSYPLDSLRPAGKKAKALKGAIKADRKTYNNPAWEQGVAFNLNIMASALGVTPQGFGELVVDTSYMLGGQDLQGWTLSEVAEWYNEMMTYWDSLGIENPTAYAELGTFANSFLKRLNDGFSATVSSGNSAIDTTAVKTGDIHVLGNKKNPYAVTLAGTATATSVGLVEYVPGIAPEIRVYDAGFDEEETNVPVTTMLSQNYPNPFNPSTVISYALSAQSVVTLKIYDMLGREVSTLLQNEETEAGVHEYTFDATALSSGMYFYRLTVNPVEEGEAYTDVKRMVLVK